MKTLLGDVCAYIPAQGNDTKNRYPKIGTAFIDHDNESRISIKLDTIPLAGGGWNGWVNIFPPRSKESAKHAIVPVPDAGIREDDIPF